MTREQIEARFASGGMSRAEYDAALGNTPGTPASSASLKPPVEPLPPLEPVPPVEETTLEERIALANEQTANPVTMPTPEEVDAFIEASVPPCGE